MTATFPRFNQLPPELRVKIWIAALPPPYLLIQRDLPTPRVIGESVFRPQTRCSHPLNPPRLRRPVPAVLHVCRESRNEFLSFADKVVQRNGHRVYSYYSRRGKSGAVFFSSSDDMLLLEMDGKLPCST